MNIAERLDSMRKAFPAFSTLAYADISTGMILYASAESELRQEHLDALCATAVEMLQGAAATQVAQALGAEDAGDIHEAIIMEPGEIGIFLKSTCNPADALCCVGRPSIDLAAFRSLARDHLDAIGEDR